MTKSAFFNLDFEKIYPTPSPERMAQAFFNRIWRKLHVENFSFLIVFYGRHRTGKSMGAVSFCHILDETFEPNLENRVVYSSRALINAFKDIRQKKIKGAGIIVDEAGTGDLSSQRWYEDMAKLVSANLQAVGYLNPFVCFVTPNFSFINNVARKLSQGVFEVTRSHTRYAIIKPFWIENSPWQTGVYRKYPIFCENHGGIPSSIYKVNQIRIGLPVDRIRERYQAHSQAYKDNFMNESEEQVASAEFQKTMKSSFVSGITAIADEVFTNIDDYKGYGVGKNKDQVSQHIIRLRHGLSQSDSKTVRLLVTKRLSENKGKVNDDALQGIEENS